jgi:hypothetical protein
MKKLFFLIPVFALLLGFLGCQKTCELPAPKGIVSKNISATSVDLTWEAAATAVEISEASTLAQKGSIVASENTTATTFSTSKLSASKSYVAKVTPRCKNQASLNFATATFQTPSPCDLAAVTNLTTKVSPASVLVNFTTITGVQSYKINIFTDTQPKVLIASRTVATQQIPVNIPGLKPGTAYTIEVAAGCSGGSFSNNLAKGSFITPFIIEEDIIMFGSKAIGGDPKFDDPCKIGTKNTLITLTSGSAVIPISDNGIHYIKITDGISGVTKCEFRLANHYVTSMNVMKFCYKDICPDTEPLEEPKNDPATGTLYFDLPTSTSQMRIGFTRTDFTITLPTGYNLNMESSKW